MKQEPESKMQVYLIIIIIIKNCLRSIMSPSERRILGVSCHVLKMYSYGQKQAYSNECKAVQMITRNLYIIIMRV